MAEAASLAMAAARPIDDLRGSANYRREMVRVAVLRLLHSLAEKSERLTYPTHPILLSRTQRPLTRFSAPQTFSDESHKAIETTINGNPHYFATGHHKSLLRLLREDAGLIGTKEGCAEGECGACTVFLDGQAVMSCMVPAPRAHHAFIETIEGVTRDGELHPVQSAFIEAGAVQCGYCTPGFVMSAAMLLEETPSPDRQDIVQALTGNLCRCTGYYKIIEAIEKCSFNPNNQT
jgi:carbon-monoxide dehydrogenase medium subunit